MDGAKAKVAALQVAISNIQKRDKQFKAQYADIAAKFIAAQEAASKKLTDDLAAADLKYKAMLTKAKEEEAAFNKL